MNMNPQLIRAADLLINKSIGRVPLGYPGTPRYWEAIKAKPIINLGSLFDGKRLRGDDAKTQFGGCDDLQV
jgi:hypothetical protein